MAAFGDYDQGAAPEQRDAFELLPKGRYLAQIVESDVKDNSKQTGKVLNTTWEILTDGYKGRKVWGRINVQHSSAEAQRIGQIELANLKAAIGMSAVQVRDTLQLHNKQMAIDIEIEKSEDPKYKDKNIIARYYPADQVNAGTAPAAQAPAASGAPAPGAAAPRPQAPAQAPAPAPASATAASAPRPPWMKAA